MKKKLEVKEIIIDETDNTGVNAISLVSSPAMEEDFLKFSNSIFTNVTLAKEDNEYTAQWSKGITLN